MTAVPPPDWQTAWPKLSDHGQYLLENGIWSDCSFIVGAEPHQQVFVGHKLFLAMTSPVFKAMFHTERVKEDPIDIFDINFLEQRLKDGSTYIYTNRINLKTFDQACNLCYAAKQYMLPHLMEECTEFLGMSLSAENAYQAYEFGKLISDPLLMEECINIICKQTSGVLLQSSFDEVQLSTILILLDQNVLHIQTEMELLTAITRYADRHYQSSARKPPNEPSARHPKLRDAIMKIRFLTLSPHEFAEGPATSNLLSESEKFAILMNILAPGDTTVQMPPGFSASTVNRQNDKLCTDSSSK